MIPIADRLRTSTFPYVNIAIIVLNFVVFFYELSLALPDLNLFFFDWGAVPVCLTDRLGLDTQVSPDTLNRFGLRADASGDLVAALCDEDRALVSPFSAMFIHGGWLHILGNMLFLWIFGDNVEDRFGHVRYLLFYLASGLAAAAAHVAFNSGQITPAVGASGAIAGVMGAYIVMFPRARVAVIIPWFWFLGAPYMPALFLIGIWFIMQLWGGLVTMGQAGGVAWWAHVGGFAFGAGLTWLLAVPGMGPRSRPPPPAPWRGD